MPCHIKYFIYLLKINLYFIVVKRLNLIKKSPGIKACRGRGGMGKEGGFNKKVSGTPKRDILIT
jgi:hypothetical protein